MRVENSVELASLATGAGRPSGRRKPAAGPAPTLCLHFAPPEINFSQGEVANAAAAPADAARNDGGEWWRGTVQRAPHLPAPARAVPCRRPWPQLAGAAAERPAEPGCRDRHAVTMPRPPAAPGAPAEGAAALLRRREAFSKGHSVSLDSADGLVTAAGADAAPPAGRAAAHESGSLSDTEEPAPDSSVFSRLRLRVRQSPPPPPPAAHSKKAPERPQSPKAKARRVDRLPLTIQPVYFSINKPAGTPHTTSQTLPKKFKAQNAPVPEEDASLAPIKPTHVRHKSDPVKDWEPPSTEQQSEPPAQASNPRDSLLLDALLKEINSDTCLLDRDDKQTAAAAVDETPATTKSGEDGTSSTPSAHAGSDSAQLSQPAEAIAQSPANETDTPAENTAGKSAKQTAECSTPPADGKQPLSNETKATDDAPQPAHEDVLNINLDQLDEDGAEAISQVQENFRQAVKMAVETLLSEVSAGDEQTELTSLPSGAEHEREVAHVRVEGKEVVDEWTGAEDLTTTVTSVRKEQRQTDQTLPPLLELEGKAASISQHDDTTERRQARPRRFKSKSLSPVPFRFAEEQLPQLVEEAAEPETLQRPAASRAKSRSLEHKQRSFDLLDRPPRERKRNQKRKEKVGFMLTTDQDSLSSSSSDEAHSRGRSQTLDPDFARPKAEKMRLKSHSARGRTTSDTATLRPLLTHQSHMGELLTLDEPLRFGKGRRHASPSFLSYDSDVDRFPRSPHGPRRRLRGPYGEMLEGKMSRGDTNRMARDDDSLKFLSSLVESASPSPTPANSSPRVSRQERSSGPPRTPSDGELVQLEPSHVRTVSSPSELAHFSELLSEGYYDGVSPAAEGLISQLTAQEVGQLRAQPRKRIPEILEIHEDFLRELLLRADNWSSQQGIGEVFLDKLTQPCVLDTYTAFVNNWPTAREALRRACQLKPGLAKYLESLERSNKRKLSFTHLLIMPVQRIPRYELLLKAYEVWASLSETEQRDAEIVRDKLHSAFAMGPDAAMSELYRRRLEPGMTGIDALRGVSVSGGSVRFGSEDPAATEQREAPPEREVCRAVGTAAGVQREAPPEREVCRAVGTAVGVQREAPPEREVCRAVGTAAGVQREAPPEREACRAVGTAAGVQREAPPEREACRAVDMGPELRINETDFTAVFDAGVWTVRWKWAGGVDPPPLRNSTAQYGIPRGSNVTVWTDASSIARGVVLADPVTDAIIEDASWLRAEAERDVHINISELDAALNGVNMALAWGFRRLTLRTDSVTVHRWLSDALSGKARLRTKGQSEMLIRRRVAVFRQLVAEYELEVTIELVGSAANRADEMTRVPNAWLQAADRPAADSPDKSPPAAVAAITSSASPGDIRAIHENIGHQGVRRTLWYARRELGVRRVTKTAVRDVVRRCQTCASIDPAPERWLGGSLETERTWDRLAMDVTHLHGHPYLTLVDCGPSRYAIWRRLRRSGALEIVQHLEDVFLERGAPAEILTDNATEFRGRAMMALAARWDVAMRFRAAYEPGGNGVVERHHRTIKVMVARQACSVAEAVHRYNVTPKDGSDPATAPINEVFRHPGRDVDVTPRGRTNGQQCDALPLKTPGVYQQLVAHTPADHPDLEPLRSALAEVHLLATRINSLEQETMQNEALLQMLREVEAAVDGLDGLVTPDRVLVRHDQVTMTSALGTKKDRCLFLFNDLLVIASSKRRTGTARKPSTALDGSVTGLEANKYKLLMKIPLADLNIARSKDENLSSLLKEVEKIEEDITTLRQIGIMVCKLHCNHYQVEELVKEMANVLNKQLAERHRADSQLVMTQLNVTTPDGIENISMNFPEIEKRTAWEQTFNETKQKLALSAERRPVPEFLYPLPIRKTRAGLQFTCAAATPSLSSRQCSDVWVCNSDGYVGQICVLSLRPEPTVTSCNGVCNSRILCIAPVPGSTLRINGSPEPTRCASTPPTGSEPPAAAQSGDEKSGTIDLDSSSDSSDSDESRADDWRDDSSATGGGGAAGSSWDMQSPEVIQVASTAVNRLAVVSGKLWACSQNRIRVINPTTSAIEQTVTVSSDSQATVQALVPSGLGVWLSFHNLGTVRLFHTITFEMICEVDVTSAVTRMLSGCDDIIRQHKTACLRVTSLMVCKDLLWIGTSAGVILNLPLPLLTTTTSWLTNTLSIADPALFARLTDHGKSIRFSFY
ncbi:Rho guanine nucleotide exchange factor 17 [Amphibalanus amphitrite]|uniref:Rho guanine nucleotide exchange factor 17 n=1 Tax=Amphibalanus amphitrite TaxID=1232801 RepID=A0A6A4V132_AMPAM|nr:Rho guanine nucleotide exchange factor 17 [Amphibalanus amphitrite]